MKSRTFWFASLLLPLLVLAGCSLAPKSPQVVGQVQTPLAVHSVRLYTSECKPVHYQTIAKLDASKLGAFSSYQFNVNWLRQLRRQAAGVGANGLLLIPTNRARTTGNVRRGPSFRARAVRTSEAVAASARSGFCTAAVDKLLSYKSSVAQFAPSSEPRR